MTARQKFIPSTIVLLDDARVQLAHAALDNAPLDADKPLEMIIREQVKTRKLDQQALMWVGPLADIANQAWIKKRRYSAKVWHEEFKIEFLPEGDELNLHELVKNPFVYQKWDYTPKGDRVLIGSTTDLTVKGFAQYLDEVYAYGANLGVLFSAPIKRKMNNKL